MAFTEDRIKAEHCRQDRELYSNPPDNVVVSRYVQRIGISSAASRKEVNDMFLVKDLEDKAQIGGHNKDHGTSYTPRLKWTSRCKWRLKQVIETSAKRFVLRSAC